MRGGAWAFMIAGLAVAGTGMAVLADGLDAAIGRALFARVWVAAPSSTRANDGLGPLFNARSCAACHVDEGAGRRPTAESLVLRFSDPAGMPDPVYGRQLQTQSLAGQAPEGVLAAGPAPADLAYGPLAPATVFGARLAPGLRGLGGLAEVPDAAILALADPDDADGDGVSGRPHRLPDGSLGRFGWKASASTLAAQIETAFALDLGMSTAGHPGPAGDCTAAQPACLAGPHGGDDATPEIVPEIVGLIAAYVAALPRLPPAADGPGAALFDAVGCAACHRPALPDGAGAAVRAYTDLLLHDLGPGLDGGATEPGVAPGEWRTAPLFSIGALLAAGGGLLHDGRASDIAAAIAQHGGEADGARRRFDALAAEDRQALLDFVGGL